LINMMYKGLRKQPQQRFKNGLQLQEYIWQHSIHAGGSVITNDERTALLEQEVKRLREENRQLQQQLQAAQTGATPVTSTARTATDDYYTARRKQSSSSGIWFFTLLVIAFVIVGGYFLFFRKNEKSDVVPSGTETSTPSNKTVIGEYKVTASRAYFHNEPDASTRRNAFAIPSAEVIKAYDDKNGFIYTELTNNKGQVSKGWLRKEDLQTIDEYNQQQKAAAAAQQTQQEDVTAQLRTAARLVEAGSIAEALPLYEMLVKQNLPEAQ